MFNDSLIYFGIKHRVERCSPCPQEICRLQKVRFIPASQVNIHTKLFNKIFILRWLHLSHRNLAIFCLFLLKDYSLFDMHGMGDSSPTIPSEKDYCLLTMVLTTAVSSSRHFRVLLSSRGLLPEVTPFLGQPISRNWPLGGCQNTVMSTHWGTSLTDHMYFRALHVLGQSLLGLPQSLTFPFAQLFCQSLPFLGFDSR